MRTTFRILLLCGTVGVILAVPLLIKHKDVSKHFNDDSVEHIAQAPTLHEDVGNTFPVAGQEPEPTPAAELVLHAPDILQVGELVRLDSTPSTVDGIIWQIIPFTDDFEVIEQGRRAFLTARPDSPDKFLIIVAGAKNGVPYLKHHQIVVDKSSIDIDPSQQTLSGKIRSWLRAVEDHDDKAESANKIAAVFRRVANDDTVDEKAILVSTAAANAGALGNDLETWIPFLKPLGEELDVFVDNGQLETREQFREVWLLIASSIERVYPPPAEQVILDAETVEPEKQE